jgi:hypothetical protein
MSFHEKSIALHLALRENCSSFALSPLSFVDYQHSRMKRKNNEKRAQRHYYFKDNFNYIRILKNHPE